MKLWVDDLRCPTARNDDGKLCFMDENEDPESWHWAKTITEAIRLLSAWEVTEVSLDHDITHAILPSDGVRTGLIYAPVCCPETYEPVARFIAEMPAEFRPKLVHIHTANPAGADILKNILNGKVDKIKRRSI